jgi:RimJ/RimL family protein N-acetyltransferase
MQTLEGTHVRLEPLALSHVQPLLAAGHGGAELFRWTTVPQERAHMERYVAAAVRAREAGTAMPFATVRKSDDTVVGSTRFFDIESWAWPASHPQASQGRPDTCEIGYTWITPAAIRSAVNTEAKYLMLRQAFESWGVHGVCFHTDARNERSCNALARIVARFEGILRAHRLSTDLLPRDSARYSIVAAEWAQVRAHLLERLAARHP